MNKRLFILLITMLSCMAVWSAVGDTFKSGSLTYTILSESPKACAVTRCDNTFTGHLNIPNTVNNYKVTTIGNDGWPCFPEAISGVTIPSNVKTIEAGAFQCCRLTNVSLNNVTSIGDHAFRRCTELTSITIPSTVSELGINPFAGCDNLTSISVANNNANYYSNGNAIYEKNTDKLITGINTTIISNDTKSIGDYAFEFLTGMTGISIPDGVTSIGEYAFSDCTGLSWVYIPSSVNSIGDNAFSCCDNLQSVYVGIVEPINIDNIFYNDNEPRVYENAALYVPDGSKSAYKAATNWKKFNTIYEFSESPYIIFADSRVKSLCVANWDTNGDGELSRSEAAAVTSLGTVFKYNRDIKTFTELEFFTGLQRIDEEAFMNCKSLKTITFPASIKSVGQDAFYECRALTKPITKDVQAWAAINFELDPESSWDNPDWPAYSNPVYFSHKLYTSASETLTTLTLSTTEIGDYAFAYNTVIASVSFPEGMTSIGKGAFRGCTYLQTVTANGGLGTVSDDAFKDCTNISTVNTNNLKEWCESSFAIVNEEYDVKAPDGSYAYCYYDYDGPLPITLNRPTIFSNPTSYSKSLKVNGTLISELVLPGDINQIGSGAFVYCNNIIKVTFPSNDNLNSVGTLAFEGCTNLSRCETNDLSTWATINFWEYRCPHYECTLVPDEENPGYYDLSTLTDGYFYSSNPIALTGDLYYNNVLVAGEVSIPEGVTSLGYYSFYNCTDIESITLPSTMTKVNGNAFEGCSSLTAVKSMAVTPPTYVSSFPNSVLNGTLYVPYGSKNAYMTANGWKNFNIVEIPAPEPDIPEAIYYLKNVETGKYLNTGNAYGTHAILADEPLPARISKQQDGSYTIFFPVGSKNLQLLFRMDETNVYVDYTDDYPEEWGNPCPYWNFTMAGEDTYHIQSLITHESFGQSAMPGTYLGNNPNKEGTDNDVDGNIPDEEGMNITWQLVPESPHTVAQVTRLQKLITQATTLNLNTDEAQALLGNENSTYTEVLMAIYALENLIDENVEMINIVKNSNLESTNVSCFYSRENYSENETVVPATIVDGAGKDGSRGIVITSIDNPSVAWDTQSFLRLPQTLPAGTKYRLSFDYKASQEARVTMETHAEPSDFIDGFDETQFTTEWQHYEREGKITEEQSPADHLMRTITFTLANIETATTYYFDNIVFEVDQFHCAAPNQAIEFADANVKAICVANWDTNGDGELSEKEAVAVTDLGTVFQRNTEITSFNELKYFTGLQFNDQYVSGNTYSGIPGFAFTECTNLKEVALPEVEAIGDAAFMNSGLTAITLPGTVKVIRDGAFSGTEISSFVLPASVTDITYGIIEDCPNLESIVVESGNTVYDSRDNCNAIIKTADNALVIGCASTNIPATVTRLQDYAFQRCKGLGEVALSDNITSIGRNAFTYSGITSLSIGKGLSSIGESAFSSLDNLSSITIDEENATYDSRDNCNAIIRKADNTLIAGCGGTVIPATVTVIGEEAFWECGNLTSITIPATVTTIGDAAFWRCKNLQSVTVEWTEPIKIPDAFSTDLTGNNAILYVPSGTKDAYEAANYWKDFKEIVEVESKPDLTVGVEDVTVKEGTNIEGEKLAHFDFENDETMMGWGNDQEMGIANGSYDGSKYQTVTNPKKAEFWENQVVTDFAELVPGEAYVLHFWAKADKSFWMNANFQFPDEDAGWPSRGDFDWFEVGTEWKEYTLAATVTGTGCTRLILNIGELDGGIFCLDDVTLTRRNPLFTLTFDGFLEGDDETTAFTTMPVATTTATNDSPAGNYPITFIGGSSEKYNIIFTPGTLTIEASENITFADAHVKEICVANWDINGDGELSEAEAAKVTDISYKFKESDITSFDELQYFTRLQSLAGWGAFFNCGSLKSITVPKNVSVIESAAFGGCAALENIKVDPENPTFVSVNNAVIEKASNKLVVGCKTTEIPNTVTAIGECAFFGNGELYSIQIPESVTSIDWFAFGWCGNLEEITIPATVTSIGAEAFSGCGNLNTVTVNRPEPIALDGITTFKLCNDDGQPSGVKIEATLYVPAGSIAAYKAANVWKAFGTILEQGTVLTKENRIIGNDVKVYIGYTADLQINMSNEDTFTAYQFDLELPNGITIAKDENKKYIVTKSDRYSDKSQQVKIEELGNNTFRFICVSMNNGVINGTEGAILSISLKANAEMAEEMNNGAIKNIIMTTTDESMFCSEDCPFTIETMTLLKGDANGDNNINVVDIVSMINYIMGHPSDKFIFLAADLNDDNEVDVFDVMKGLNLALKNKAAARSMARATSGTEEMVTVTTTAGGMVLDINDPARFTAFQFDVEVTEGVELTDARLTADAAHHTLRFTKNGQNTYRVIGMSMDNSTLSANGNGLIELSFSKNGHMQISNVIFVTPQETNVYFASDNIVVTGIGSIEHEQAEEIYDLSGRKVDTDRSHLPKGVYIINNKKVVIK